MKNKKYLHIYSDILITSGIQNITLIDTSRNKVYSIPISYIDLINDLKNKTYSDIIKIYDEENLYSFKNFIIENELGTFIDDNKFFLPISKEFNSPEKINNSIIEISEIYALNNLPTYIKQIDNLGCKFYELRIHIQIKVSLIEEVLNKLIFNSLKSILIFIPYSSDMNLSKCKQILARYPFVKTIFIYNSLKNKEYFKNDIPGGNQKIFFTTQNDISHKSCGCITTDTFVVRELNQLSENFAFNSCLNKKLSIDCFGNIKNCPSMNLSFGNINDCNLNEIIDSQKFKEIWSLKKDSIEVCKDCEFRYICTDCRAYIQNPQNLNSKPLKCGYDPYTGIWEDWKLNQLNSKAIVYYGL